MDDLKWDDLRTFLAVARGGTLASAATALGVNASTVHRRVAALEASLEAALFERDPRGYALTGVGEALVPRAQEVEEAVLALRRAATGHDRSARGPVRFTMPETLLPVVVPMLSSVYTQCPGLRPILRAEDQILDLGADADIALRPSATPPPSAVGRRIGVIGWAVYGPSCALEVSLPWVIYGAGARPLAAMAWRRRRHPDASVRMEVSSVGAMHRVLGCSHAQGLLPCYLGDAEPSLARRGALVEAAQTDLWLLIHADLRRSARVRALVELLAPQLEQARGLFAGEPLGE